MKTSLLTLALLVMGFAQAQDLQTIYKDKIKSRSTTEVLKEGLSQIEDLCAIEPQEKCNKAKASALYLIADDYYNAALQVAMVELELSVPILKKAVNYYNEAEALKPIDEFSASDRFLLSSGKKNFEEFTDVKLLLEN
ncbi:hypothetical protein [Winogradskyella luteola]|uniref:Uncharacterized protein n=1 Tax=Winogradskyella luteola TaxID=2828330 RepID=A0A9X1JP59_9FLAO|nr:hypothetical protein [Winogradskyella luteola]MBV7268389.1 hypothetical protein [Winogradskyella luteola]